MIRYFGNIFESEEDNYKPVRVANVYKVDHV